MDSNVVFDEFYEVTAVDFNLAVANCSYWAKKRLFKKMEKRIYLAEGHRPPKDLEAWVTHFVLINRDKGQKDAARAKEA